MKKKFSVKKMVLLAMLAAVAYLMVALIRIPVVLFLKYEPKDVIITIAGFMLGPMASFIISFVVSLIEMVTISDTGPIGALMNLLSTCTFACTAAWVYKRKHTAKGALWGLLIGSVAMVATMLLWNYLITPLYMTGTSRSDVAGMLIPVFLPFNLLKAGLNSAFILALYKPLVTALRKTRLLETKVTQNADGAAAGRKTPKLGVYIVATALLVTCVMVWLVLRGII